MSDNIWKAYSHGMNVMLQEGSIQLSALLLRSYSALGLSDSEAMLLMQIMEFVQLENKPFPTPEELAYRMNATSEQITTWLQKLFASGFLTIEQEMANGIISESYNWSGWYMQASKWYAQQLRNNKKSEKQQLHKVENQEKTSGLFTLFEQEFGRPLSPMEYETISGWVDEDRYNDEIIKFALKEAVFAGKLSFRYIDRILIEWSRNRITTAEEAKLHTQKFYSKH